MEAKEIKLPSGATLRIRNIPFSVARELFESVQVEAKTIKFDKDMELSLFFKDIFCTIFSSQIIKPKLAKAMGFCTYDNGNGELRVEDSIFEPMEARKDYVHVCLAVGQECVLPFMSDLSQVFSQVFALMGSTPA